MTTVIKEFFSNIIHMGRRSYLLLFLKLGIYIFKLNKINTSILITIVSDQHDRIFPTNHQLSINN